MSQKRLSNLGHFLFVWIGRNDKHCDFSLQFNDNSELLIAHSVIKKQRHVKMYFMLGIFNEFVLFAGSRRNKTGCRISFTEIFWLLLRSEFSIRPCRRNISIENVIRDYFQESQPSECDSVCRDCWISAETFHLFSTRIKDIHSASVRDSDILIKTEPDTQAFTVWIERQAENADDNNLGWWVILNWYMVSVHVALS